MSPPNPAPPPAADESRNRFRFQIGYMPNFATSDTQLRYQDSRTDGSLAPTYDYHSLDLHLGWQYLTSSVDFNLAARLGWNIFHPADSRFSTAPNFMSFEPGVFVSAHWRPIRYIGLGGGVFLGAHIFTGSADVGNAEVYNFDPNVLFNIAPEATIRFYPVDFFTIDVGARMMVNPGSMTVPAPREGDPAGRIEARTGDAGPVSGGLVVRVGMALPF